MLNADSREHLFLALRWIALVGPLGQARRGYRPDGEVGEWVSPLGTRMVAQ
jgi:hypothetical protein